MLLRNRSADCLPFIKKLFLRVFVIVCVSVCGCFIFSWKIWRFSERCISINQFYRRFGFPYHQFEKRPLLRVVILLLQQCYHWVAKLMTLCGGSEAVLENKVNGFNNMKLTDMHFSKIFLFWNLGICLWPKVSHWPQIYSAYEPAFFGFDFIKNFISKTLNIILIWVTNGKSGTEGSWNFSN